MNEDDNDTAKGYKSGDANVASENESNNVEDGSDEVFFPVTIVSKSIIKSDVNATNNQQEDFKDENAVTRCFDLSVEAHMRGSSVPRYEPLAFDAGASP